MAPGAYGQYPYSRKGAGSLGERNDAPMIIRL